MTTGDSFLAWCALLGFVLPLPCGMFFKTCQNRYAKGKSYKFLIYIQLTLCSIQLLSSAVMICLAISFFYNGYLEVFVNGVEVPNQLVDGLASTRKGGALILIGLLFPFFMIKGYWTFGRFTKMVAGSWLAYLKDPDQMIR